jgi:plastocyanin
VTVTGESMATPDATPPEAAGATPSTADVAIVDFAFEPEIATIAVGGTITWTNTGQAPHTIFADWADSDIMDPGVTFSWTFEEAGTYDYICGLHPAMTGTIEVVAAAGRATGTPTMGEIQGPGGVWLIGYEFDEPDLLPNQQALVSFEPAGVLQVDLVSESEPQSLTGGHGSWSVNEDGTINSSWFVLFRDTTSGEVLTIRIDDSAEADATGSYAGTIDVEVTTENGSTANLTGTSAGRRLSP